MPNDLLRYRFEFEQRPVLRLDPDGPGDHVHVGELRQAGRGQRGRGRAVGAAAGAVRALQPAVGAAQRAEGAAGAVGRGAGAAQTGLGLGRLRRHPSAARLRAAQGQRPPRRVHRRQVDVQSDTPRDIIFSIQ